MSYIIQRSYDFCAAHRIEGHPKCGRIHGHNYFIKVALRQRFPGPNGMVMDFGDLDKVVKPLLESLDHRYMVSKDNLAKNDPYAELAISQGHACLIEAEHSTAEDLASMIHTKIRAILRFQASDISVEVTEMYKVLESKAEYVGE